MTLDQTDGAEFRETSEAERGGQHTRIVAAEKVYPTDVGDLWDALTNAERIPRWFLAITGDLRLAGRYQLEGNAGGEITRCDAPNALDVTWEFGGHISWVRVRLEPRENGTLLRLEHEMLKDEAGEEHWAQYGPGATGVGWDLSLFGLAQHIKSGGDAPGRDGDTTWATSDDGRSFMKASADAWGQAHVDSGEHPKVAGAMAARTGAAYAGE